MWATSTAGTGADHLVMQSDGNLVVCTSSSTAKWSSKTSGSSSSYAVMQNDGNLVVYSGTPGSSGKSTWASGTDVYQYDLRSVDACVVPESDHLNIAVGWIAGTPATFPSGWGAGSGNDASVFGCWSNTVGGVDMVNIDATDTANTCTVTDHALLPSRGSQNEALKYDFGMRDIQMVAGSLDQGETGDCVQALVRAGGVVTIDDFSAALNSDVDSADVLDVGDLYANTFVCDPTDDRHIDRNSDVRAHRTAPSAAASAAVFHLHRRAESLLPCQRVPGHQLPGVPRDVRGERRVYSRQYVQYVTTATIEFAETGWKAHRVIKANTCSGRSDAGAVSPPTTIMSARLRH